MDRKMLIGLVFALDFLLLYLIVTFAPKEQFLAWYAVKNLSCYFLAMFVANKKIARSAALPNYWRLAINASVVLIVLH